jgi:hypothetical protein
MLWLVGLALTKTDAGILLSFHIDKNHTLESHEEI